MYLQTVQYTIGTVFTQEKYVNKENGMIDKVLNSMSIYIVFIPSLQSRKSTLMG